MFAIPMNLCGVSADSIYLAADESVPIEEPVDDGFLARGKSFFMYTFSKLWDGAGELFTKISGKKVAKYQDVTLDIGADKPFTFIHITDTHLSRANMNDGYAKLKLAKERAPGFPDSVRMLNEISQKAEEMDCFVVHSGDMIDFVSEEDRKSQGREKQEQKSKR